MIKTAYIPKLKVYLACRFSVFGVFKCASVHAVNEYT